MKVEDIKDTLKIFLEKNVSKDTFEPVSVYR